MAIAYFDCFSGVAGDMILGAFVDAGLPLSHLKGELSKISLPPYNIIRVKGKAPLKGTNLRVVFGKELGPSRYPQIDRLIAGSALRPVVRDMARAIFGRLAKAEARVHGTSLNRVHFHEVGAVDSVVDIVGAAIGFDYFKFSKVFASPLPITRGRVKCAHGQLPVPPPAVLELLKGVPVEPSHVRGEIVTPTGAAILVTVVECFGECPLQVVNEIGYGFGDRVIPGLLNALRLMIGEGFPAVVIETNLDDMNPQLFDVAMAATFSAGAVDVFLETIQMKKDRPGVKLCAIAPWEAKEAVIDAILKETTSFGVRYWPVGRRVLERRLREVKTRAGGFLFKIGIDAGGRMVKAMPEFESVRKVARKKRRPLIQVYQEALALASRLTGVVSSSGVMSQR